MKLTDEILENAAQFYLNDHSLREACEMIYGKYGVTASTSGVGKRLIQKGVNLRNRKEIARVFLRKKLPKGEVEKIIKMYVENMCSIRKISRDLKLKRRIIRRVLIEYGIKKRDDYTSLKLTNQKHGKVPFDGDEKEKAYFIGLVRGDLTPIKKSKYTLRLSVSSTHKNFLLLLKSIFSKYGPVYIYPVKNWDTYKWNITIDLDATSFDFLLDAKEGYTALWSDKNSFLYFLAGLIDSDGSVYIRKTRKYAQYMVRVFSQDCELLEKIDDMLAVLGFNPILYMSSKKGEIRNHKGRDIIYNEDYYILELSRRDEVFRLLTSLPLKHPEKMARKEIVLDLIKKRVSYYKDTERMVELRNKIEEEVKRYVKEAEIEYKRGK